MYYKKGGLVVIFLFILLVPNVNAVEWTKWGYFTSPYGDTGPAVSEDSDTYFTNYGALTNNYPNSACEGECGGDISEPSLPSVNSDTGCMVLMVEGDRPHLCSDADDCSAAYTKKGFVISAHTYTPLEINGKFNWGDDDGEDAGNLWNDGWAAYQTPVVCGSDNRWYGCNENVLKETIEISTGQDEKGKPTTDVFICLQNQEGAYVWVNQQNVDPSVDRDGDNIPDPFDCAPDDKHVFGFYPAGCKMSCSPDDEECVVCVNKEAPKEICGDGIDNDCSLGRSPYGINDDCDLPEYAFACSGTTDEKGVQGACLTSDGKCAFLPNAEEGKKCCGDDGLTDLGTIDTTDPANALLCLSGNTALVPQHYTTPTQRDDGTPNPQCSDQWCWVDDGDEAFKIKTITKVESNNLITYDVVSNGEGWFECKLNPATNQLTNDKLLRPSAQVPKANRFYCYQEGDHYAWAE